MIKVQMVADNLFVWWLTTCLYVHFLGLVHGAYADPDWFVVFVTSCQLSLLPQCHPLHFIEWRMSDSSVNFLVSIQGYVCDY